MIQEDPISLLFHFADRTGKIKPQRFHNPREVYVADCLADIIPTFKKVQKALDAGYYAAGYVSYEAAPAFDKHFKVKAGAKMPLVWFGIFDKPVEYTEDTLSSFSVSDWVSDTDSESYSKGFQTIKEEIEKGNSYQVNYTMRLRAHFEGDPRSFFNRLSQSQRSNYSAYLNLGRYKILSASPELFFHWEDGQLITRPMKGTVKRSGNHEQDRANARWLENSEKNQAENLMIVDLLRNDMGMVSEEGTIKVTKLKEIEKYPTVWQMTSTITAKTKTETTILDVFRALFPCGSITGAPKIKTMEIISELENSPREVYCGAIGYITPDRVAVFNVPIRTVVIDNETNLAEYGVGGGITWDSTNNEEYEEALLKAKLLTEERPHYQLLETLRLENGEYVLLDGHIERMKQSAEYFDFQLSSKELRNKLEEYASLRLEALEKVRVLVSEEGVISVSGQEMNPFGQELSVVLANDSVHSENPFLHHKTTHREVYDKFKRRHPGFDDVLLWNEKGDITEFTNGNIIVKINGELFTPPLESGLLAGTYRQDLLNRNVVREKKINKVQLSTADEVWFVNSVRGKMKVNLTIN